MRRSLTLLSVVGLFILSVACRSYPDRIIRIENDYFSYVITPEGRNDAFVEKQTDIDYLAKDSISYCAYIQTGDVTYLPSRVEKQNHQLVVTFEEASFIGFLSVTAHHDRIIIKVDSVKGNAERFTFLNVPLTLDAVPDESFATCALSLNLQTQVEQLPALQTHLQATCYDRFGLTGSEVAIVGVPQQEILPTIRKVMQEDSQIPVSDKGGAWAQLNKEGYGSYLMDFGALTLETVDDWIAKCDSLGFNQLAIHGANSFFKNGDFELHPDKWPGGWDDFKKINDRLHRAGISSILLTYAYFIDKSSRYVTPVPSEDLGYFNAFSLVKPLGPGDTEIVVAESTAGVSAITGYFIQNSATLRIGEELIEFSGVTQSPPFRFTGVKRGVNGTRARAHQAGTKAYHLQEMFGQFVPGPETALFDEIARKTAEIINENNFDGLYLDAIDGNNMLGGKENAWYYGTRFVLEIARHLKPMVGMEMCDMPHHYWHYSSRWQAWDKAVRGYKRFVDVHMAALKSDDHRHGEWIGYTETINRLAPLKNGRLMLPLHMGWWGNSIWASPQVETTFPDDMEYLLAKMIGNDAGLSMLGGTEEKILNEKPLLRKLVGLTRKYELLRRQGYFSEGVKERLRQPGEEFTLEEVEGKSRFRSVAYDKKMATGKRSGRSFDNRYEDQPLKLRIQAQMSADPFEAAGNRLLTTPTNSREFSMEKAAQGVTGTYGVGEANGEVGSAAVFKVGSNGASLREGSWIKWEKRFEPCLDLSRHQGLGVWVKGDGSGALLNLRTESPKHLSMGGRGDHFVKLDFTGWRYFELVEIESSAFNDYLWPDEFHNVYNSYFYKVVFDCVDKLQVWVNNVPPGKEVEVQIGAVKALPLRSQIVENPTVKLGGSSITFPVKMSPGMYLEFNNEKDCKLFSAEGKLLEEVTPLGDIPRVKPGKNELEVWLEPAGDLSPRADVTIITYGELID